MATKKTASYRFGEKIKKVRERQKITLSSLAGSIGVSTSLLSQIEHNRISPSLDTLLAITDALQIDPEYLFRDHKKPKAVALVTKDQRNLLKLKEVTYEQLSASFDPQDKDSFEVMELQIAPGGTRGNTEFGHPGREMGIIIEGEGRLIYDQKTYHLYEDDSISFSSSQPHSLENTGDSMLRAVWIVTPPRIFE